MAVREAARAAAKGAAKVETGAVKVRVVRVLFHKTESRRLDRKFRYTHRNLMLTCDTSLCRLHRNRRNQRQICSTRHRPLVVKVKVKVPIHHTNSLHNSLCKCWLTASNNRPAGYSRCIRPHSSTAQMRRCWCACGTELLLRVHNMISRR